MCVFGWRTSVIKKGVKLKVLTNLLENRYNDFCLLSQFHNSFNDIASEYIQSGNEVLIPQLDLYICRNAFDNNYEIGFVWSDGNVNAISQSGNQ